MIKHIQEWAGAYCILVLLVGSGSAIYFGRVIESRRAEARVALNAEAAVEEVGEAEDVAALEAKALGLVEDMLTSESIDEIWELSDKVTEVCLELNALDRDAWLRVEAVLVAGKSETQKRNTEAKARMVQDFAGINSDLKEMGDALRGINEDLAAGLERQPAFQPTGTFIMTAELMLGEHENEPGTWEMAANAIELEFPSSLGTITFTLPGTPEDGPRIEIDEAEYVLVKAHETPIEGSLEVYNGKEWRQLVENVADCMKAEGGAE